MKQLRTKGSLKSVCFEGATFIRLTCKIMILAGMLSLIVPSAIPAQAIEPRSNSVIAQNNPFGTYDNIDDNFHLMMIETLRMVEAARAAMKSNDPEVKRMTQESYNMGMQQLQSMMSMWMKKNPIRSTSPR
jgi:hypothetical protein